MTGHKQECEDGIFQRHDLIRRKVKVIKLNIKLRDDSYTGIMIDRHILVYKTRKVNKALDAMGYER